MSGAPSRPDPSRGVLAGIRNDLKHAKKNDGTYDPRGGGSAWSHNFLNQKPWHPMNFRNQIKLFDAEARAVADAKSKEEGLAEFKAEQDYMKTLSYLSKEKQEEYRAKQSVSFMYTKPPGLDAALAKEKEQAETAVRASNAAAATGLLPAPDGEAPSALPAAHQPPVSGDPSADPTRPDLHAQRAQDMAKLREDPFAAMLAARTALEASDKFVLKHGVGGRSPTRGGLADDAENQQMLVEEAEEPVGGWLEGDTLGLLDPSLLQGLSEKDRKRVTKAVKKAQQAQEEKRQVEAAEAVLRAAGYDMEALKGKHAGKKHKKKHKSKDSKRHKEKKARGKAAGRGEHSEGSGEEGGEELGHKQQRGQATERDGRGAGFRGREAEEGVEGIGGGQDDGRVGSEEGEQVKGGWRRHGKGDGEEDCLPEQMSGVDRGQRQRGGEGQSASANNDPRVRGRGEARVVKEGMQGSAGYYAGRRGQDAEREGRQGQAWRGPGDDDARVAGGVEVDRHRESGKKRSQDGHDELGGDGSGGIGDGHKRVRHHDTR